MKEHWYASMVIECPTCGKERTHVIRIPGPKPWIIEEREIHKSAECTKCKNARKL
jgi:hypothetical protein